MKIVHFTRLRDLVGLMESSLRGVKVQFSNEVKYLSLILDKGSTWKKQVKSSTNKAYRAFWTCRRRLGKTWGLKPNVVY